jgi:uncharacterized protein (TIGR02466 family)
MSEPGETELSYVFPVPIVRRRWSDSNALNTALRELILRQTAGTKGVAISNVGGWHSPKNLHERRESCVRDLVDRIEEMARDLVRETVCDPTAAHLSGWEIEAWANVNRRGDYNAAHIHEPKFIWSGVYYVDPGDAEPASGCIKFEDRSGVAKEIVHNPDPFEREVAVKPEAGLMLMFPVTLFHYVEPYLGQSPRISIAFNLANAGFTIPVYDYVRPTWWSEPPRIVHEFRRLKARLGLRKPMR